MSSKPARKRRKIGTRPNLKEIEKRRVWVRSGGRCAICNRDLLDGNLTNEPVSLGELAHIVGQQQSAGSPRGLNNYPKEKRDLADNIILACGECHAEIDDPATLDMFTVEKLLETKRNHEERIKHVTGLGRDRRTVILRMIGQLRGNPLELAQRTAVEAVIASSDRFPYFKLSYDRYGIEIELRQLPGEYSNAKDKNSAPTAEYYSSAKVIIDDLVDNLLNDGLRKGHVEHVSVFAYARLPLLVYLGRRLGDGYGVDFYQRQQTTDSWIWPNIDPPVEFDIDVPPVASGTEAILLASISGTVHENEIPQRLRHYPVFKMHPINRTPFGGIIDSRATLENLRVTYRRFFGELERHHKKIVRLHLFGALPISAAITLGRVRDPVIHPSIVTYDRVDYGSYEQAIEIR
ncbi:SAVED domain-containing protein [Streptomyces sp. NPDC052127]|uniref:SAVED domain-containing protein n=1 Tax=Streptomyces sp. NPDC052127 TaxID=3155679 RepID=UPI003437AC23